MKNQKGITRIALVITIIVLLILAGVSIAMLTGDNGLLNKSKSAAVAQAIAGAKDEVYLKHQQAMTNYLEKKYSKDDATAKFATEFDALIGDSGFETSGCTVTGTAAGGITITYKADTSKKSSGVIQADNSIKWTDNY